MHPLRFPWALERRSPQASLSVLASLALGSKLGVPFFFAQRRLVARLG